MRIYDRIRELCKRKGTNVARLESDLGFAKGSVCKIDKYKPSTERAKKIADYLGVSVEFLMTGEVEEHYYINDEGREMAQFMFDNPEYKVLFDASRKINKEDIEVVAKLLRRFGEEEKE